MVIKKAMFTPAFMYKYQ